MSLAICLLIQLYSSGLLDNDIHVGDRRCKKEICEADLHVLSRTGDKQDQEMFLAADHLMIAVAFLIFCFEDFASR